jgi:hypothetical protein
MKSIYLGIILILGLFLACDKNEVDIPSCENCDFTCVGMDEANVMTNDCIDNWECSFSVFANSKVTTDQNEGVSPGDKNVFQMISSTPGDLAIADDEFTHILVFELNENQNSFAVSDSALEGMNVFFKRVCFCLDVEFISVTEGCLQGEKLTNGNWKIQGKLNVQYSFGDVEVKFNAKFMS